MNDSQKARDYADQKQFKADVINYSEHKHYNIEGEEADKYLLELFENNFPKLHSDAMQVATTCAKEMAMAVIAGVCDVDPDLIDNFRRPNVQAALLSAQQSFAETGDPDTGTGDVALGRLLARLVVKLVTDPNRNLNEIMIRRAIAVAPNLTRQQVNSLSVLAVFKTCGFRGENPSEVLAAMDNYFMSYYDDVAAAHLEFSAMESSGVGSNLFGADAFQAIFDRHPSAMRKSFAPADIPSDVEEVDRANYLEVDPENPEMMRLREDKRDDLFGSKQAGDFQRSMELTRSVRSLRTFVGKTFFVTPQELKDRAAVEKPALHKFLTQLDDAGAFHFQINTIGYILAKQELDLRFPGNTLLEQMVQLTEANEPSPDDGD